METEAKMGLNFDKIKRFWDWFIENQNNLIPENINNNLINSLNEKILSLGDFEWEIREGEAKENMLIISPGGDIELLEESEKIIKQSPSLVGWEFLSHKPAKNWDFKFSIEDQDNIKRIIDASTWEYVLIKFSDGTYDIVIRANGISKLNSNDKYMATDIVLESILGERMSLRLIKNTELVDSFSKDDFPKKSSIRYLKEHLLKLENDE
ncbi:hypothetical protein [Sinomicrobium sp. M5D2P9]